MVQSPKRVPRGKDFHRGRAECAPGHTYTVVMENLSLVCPSKTVEYCIRTKKIRGEEQEEEGGSGR